MDQIELHDFEAQCIQECAPACTAACPLHVDARAVCAVVSKGDFSAGLQLIKKALPFPGIVCRICEQPCREVCLRDKSLAMADLERACLEFGIEPQAKAAQTVKRKQRVAVIGAGLNGLTAALDLAKKRYPVVVYEASSVLGGRLNSFSENKLPRAVVEKEFNKLYELGVEFRLNTAVSSSVGGGAVTLGELLHEFEAVYLATGSASTLNIKEAGLGSVDPQTRATSQPGIFAATDIGLSANSMPIILAMADGRSAAISIDRYVMKVSLTASRSNEGPYESCLYTNTEGITAAPVVPMNDKFYSQEEAIKEAGRCLQCECLECVKYCEYLASYDGYPKKYARSIYNNLSIVMGTRLANKMTNSCSLCGQCAEVCPTHLDMGALCKQARQTMVIQKHMPPSAHDFALRDMQFSNSDHFALARCLPGADSCSYLFFPGCQLGASAPQQVEKVYDYLRGHLSDVGLMLRCCGAPADWAGRQDLFKAALDEFSNIHEEMGKPTLVLACSSCYQVFKQNLPDLNIVSIWEIYDQYGLPETTNSKKGAVVSIHDPCTIRHEPQIHESVRRLVRQAGYKIEELPMNREKTSCCSYGGDVWLANRELSDKVIERRIAESGNDYLTYCTMCRDFFASKGKPTLHVLDLFYEDDLGARAERRGPGYSERHENRARLKKKMLKEIWRETVPEQSKIEGIQLILSDEVRQVLEDRLILVEDIQQVIEYAERTGYRLLHPQTGRLLAHYKPSQITYWVEYAPHEDAFEVYNAYSHRMEIAEELKS